MSPGRELHPHEVLADLLGSGDFPLEIGRPGGRRQDHPGTA
jgi:hypothetical protein